MGGGQGERGREILCSNQHGVEESGEGCLGRGNSKLKKRPLMTVELGMRQGQEGSQSGWPWGGVVMGKRGI